MDADKFTSELRTIEKKYSDPSQKRSDIDDELVKLVCTEVHPCPPKSDEERSFLAGICQLAAHDQPEATLKAIELFGDPKAANFALACACGLRHHAVNVVKTLVEAKAVPPDALENALHRMERAGRQDVVPILAQGLEAIKTSANPTEFWDLRKLPKPGEAPVSNSTPTPR